MKSSVLAIPSAGLVTAPGGSPLDLPHLLIVRIVADVALEVALEEFVDLIGAHVQEITIVETRR
jgi:hypothetical protein